MYGNFLIDENKTYKKYGYYSYDLLINSNKKIVVNCDNCKEKLHKQKNQTHKKHRCKIIKNNKKRCYLCNKWKNFNLYVKSKSRIGGLNAMCKKCKSSYLPAIISNNKLNIRKKLALENNDMEFYFRNRVSGLKNKCNKRNIIIDIDSLYLLGLWDKQKGKCYYSGLLMNKSMIKGKKLAWDCPSIDRLDPSKGYIRGNIVLCLFSINAFKGNLTEKEFKNKLQEIKWIL